MIEDSNMVKGGGNGWRKRRNGKKRKTGKKRRKNGNFSRIVAHPCLFAFTY